MTCRHDLGLSAAAIAYGGTDHPHDPSDLLRCMNYCNGRFTTSELRTRMAGRSIYWDRLLPEWDHLTDLLRQEMQEPHDGRAPHTYNEMKRVLAAGIKCQSCSGTGRGDICQKCKGTGRRSGGQCRAPACYRGADHCNACRGNGYTKVAA
jgi:hypothetical protein